MLCQLAAEVGGAAQDAAVHRHIAVQGGAQLEAAGIERGAAADGFSAVSERVPEPFLVSVPVPVIAPA